MTRIHARSASSSPTLATLLLLLSAPVWAQTPPDAGSLLREQPRPPAQPAAPVSIPALPTATPTDTDAGPRVRVNDVRLRGATLVPEAELRAQLQPLIGQDATLGQLRRAALVLVGHYAQRGYLARVTLPPQEVRDGVVEFLVEEGRRGRVLLDRQGQRIDAERVARFVEARLAAGAPMSTSALGEALAIVNDLPGGKVSASLAPGLGEREIDVRLVADDTPLLGGNLALNNQGSRSTGVAQATAGIGLANPSGRFDAATLLLTATEGTAFARGEYSLAVGDRGLRLGVNASHLRYELVLDSLAALQSAGTARTTGLWFSLPLVRRSTLELGLSGGYDHKRLVDRTAVGETGNRTVRVLNLAAAGELTRNGDALPGVYSFNLGLTLGHADQHNAAARAADAAGRHTQGRFAKLAWNLGLERPLGALWTFSASLGGQWADTNLDSSERYALGGPNGVRAYPGSEATGDTGWLASVRLSRPLDAQWTVGAFVDGGEITVNRRAVPGPQTTPNRYGLSGAGVLLDWRPSAAWGLKAAIASPIGHNPGAQPDGSNSDGRRNSTRAWLSLAARF